MGTQAWRKKNIDKMRKYRRDYYHRNKAQCKASAVRRVKEITEYFRQYKADRGCARCPEKNPVCLDFHHKNKKEKEINISIAICNYGWSIKRILKETKKCIILCSNCHRKEHAKK